ncbi:hypothetical protein [Sabulicella glaciei]|uniref:Uncharacterized protein n=1 Tax=Sabulicella glaciei TaxID=2984948 RepID=A0ABT3NVC3_9PROT|nr:hypothetical protein [Roseococcus sp. MDT2-1-1]MCW8085853.1 hypothetical protein [Roseococcus sp. MDT2-1-1]
MPDENCLNIRLSEYFQSRDETRRRSAEDAARDEPDHEDGEDETDERG